MTSHKFVGNFVVCALTISLVFILYPSLNYITKYLPGPRRINRLYAQLEIICHISEKITLFINAAVFPLLSPLSFSLCLCVHLRSCFST